MGTAGLSGRSWRASLMLRAARLAHRGVCSPGRSPRPATTAGRRPSMAGWEHTPRCTRRAPTLVGFGVEGSSGAAHEAVARAAAGPAAGSGCDRLCSCLQQLRMEMDNGSAEVVGCHGDLTFFDVLRRSSLLLFVPTRRQLGARRGRRGMSRAGHGWPAAGCGSWTRRYPAGHPPVAAAGSRDSRRAASRSAKNHALQALGRTVRL